MDDIRNERLGWVDAARIPAMLFVIVQHIPLECPWNDSPLTSSLALFMILAGYFAAPRLAALPQVWGGYAGRRVVKFLRPYLVWNVIYLAGMVMCGGGVLPASLVEWIGVFGVGNEPVLVPLWFIRDLMVFLLLGALLVRCPRWVLIAAALAGLCFLPAGGGEAWAKPYMFGDFCLGMLAAGIPGLPGRWRALPLRFHVGLVAFYACVAGYSAYVKGVVYGPLTVPGVLALLSMGILLDRLPCRALLQTCARGTFFIFCFHTFVIVQLKMFLPEGSQWWLAAVPVIYGVSLTVYVLISRWRVFHFLSC